MKTTAEKIAVMQAYEDGRKIIINKGSVCAMTFSKHNVFNGPQWDWVKNDYDVVEPKPDSIDWDAVSTEFKYLVRDPDGSAFLMTEVPHVSHEFAAVPYNNGLSVLLNPTGWSASFPENQRIVSASAFSSYKKSDDPAGEYVWYRSVVKRPEA